MSFGNAYLSKMCLGCLPFFTSEGSTGACHLCSVPSGPKTQGPKVPSSELVHEYGLLRSHGASFSSPLVQTTKRPASRRTRASVVRGLVAARLRADDLVGGRRSRRLGHGRSLGSQVGVAALGRLGLRLRLSARGGVRRSLAATGQQDREDRAGEKSSHSLSHRYLVLSVYTTSASGVL